MRRSGQFRKIIDYIIIKNYRKILLFFINIIFIITLVKFECTLGIVDIGLT